MMLKNGAMKMQANNTWKEYALEDLLSYEQPTPYIVESTDYNDNYKTPVLTAGKSFIIGYTSEENGIYDKLPVIIFDDFTTATQYVNFPFKVKSSAMKILTANTDLVLPKFIFYRMQTINFDHSTHKRYWIQQYSKIKVKIPSIPEQERIVSKIEELFSELDNGIETMKKTLDKVERYKYSVIDSVIPRYHKKSIGDCIEDMGQGWSPKCERYNVVDDENWAVIKTTAIQPCDFLFEENKALPASLSPREKHEIKVGDILITRAGPKSRCGVCCMVKNTKKRLLNCDKVYRLRLNESIVLPQYLEYVLNSPAFLKEINLCKTGGNDSGLNLTQTRFLSIEIPVPTIKEQKHIINEIEAHRSVCQNIESTVNTTLQQAEALRQSILKKAFEGEL